MKKPKSPMLPPIESIISLNDLRLHARHGVGEQEQRVGGDFCLNVDLHVRVEAAAYAADDLCGTVNYAEAYDVVREAFGETSLLIEHAAWRTAQALLRRFKAVSAVDIRVEKLNPPMGADCRSASVQMTVNRS